MNSNQIAADIVRLATEQQVLLSCAESCTGGNVAAAIASVAGASAVFSHGLVTYSNFAKCHYLKVDLRTIEQHGAVSAAVAEAMALGAILETQSTLREPEGTAAARKLAVSVTGIAGPGGGSRHKPVGTVYFGLASSYVGLKPCSFATDQITQSHEFHQLAVKTRAEFILAATKIALDLLHDQLRGEHK